ncbi:MAG: FAD-dependent oxidoreductase, partial [Pseudorhodoplanes sp.]|nr:FAD-dependent oxidoreductase [Pseudorhodoplanes sp.]
MLGFLLARAGIDVHVLEKHADFFRDFRGDTIHPSTLELMHELGLLDAFLKLPHEKVTRIVAQIGEERVTVADFGHVPCFCRFIALMPQWDFLNFLAQQGARYPAFHLHMSTEAARLMLRDGKVCGLYANAPGGEIAIEADLVVGADGRHSTLRGDAGMTAEDLGAPMDVLWFRLSRKPSDGDETFGHAEASRMFIMINRGTYWQCAYIIPKGGLDALKQRGLPAFHDDVAFMSPFVKDRLDEIASWDDVKLLTVAVDRLPVWCKDGLLLIGDAAHAMSPIGGVGINLAIQDAVAAANLLWEPLSRRGVTLEHLQAVQERREWPVRVTQRIQIAVQNRIIGPLLKSTARPRAPWQLRLLDLFPVLRRIPARLVGVGVRPEHVHTPERT